MFHFHIIGQVQGVGFRPFVWRLAKEYGLKGWVNNSTDGVHVVFKADQETALKFTKDLLEKAPALARITASHLETIADQDFSGFSIVHSVSEAQPNLLLSPDFALCPICRQELHDPANRRYGYAFITCTHCGPRFSISTALPYDRERTYMAPFDQCPECLAEYNNPNDRRFFSQTNSCPKCGIQLHWTDAEGSSAEGVVAKAVKSLQQGKTLAVKGIGGYLLICDACNEAGIFRLRKNKYRPAKPLALLYPSLEMIKMDAMVQPDEQAALESVQAPIVLLDLLPEPASGICVNAIAPGLLQIGVMLPYAPLLESIAASFGGPLIATSGNASGKPIAFRDADAFRDLYPGIADALLSHNREIAIPQDDSVLRFTPIHRQKIWLRRSRGLAPYAHNFWQHLSDDQQCVLAMGASLKASFCLHTRGNLYASQYLGNLEDYDTQGNFEHTLNHFISLFGQPPALFLLDKHPEYFSTRLGLDWAEKLGVPHQLIQHHKAHFAAVLAENQLLETEEKVLGVIWDGTGYGDDGQIWGGEFFEYSKGGAMDRVGHLGNFNLLLADKMPREPRISALSLALEHPKAETVLRAKFNETEWSLYRRMLQKGGLLQCSSMGRLFDAAASVLGFCDRQSYEGEAAMLMEAAAARRLIDEGMTPTLPMFTFEIQNGIFPSQNLIFELISRKNSGEPMDALAAWFHQVLVSGIEAFARKYGYRKLAFSGGVWQNALLVDLSIHYLSVDFELYFHRDFPPNDECVAFGQMVYALNKS